MKPRECACLDPIDGVPNPNCGLCDFSGKVWPSVEGEQVAVFDGIDPARDYRDDLDTMMYEVGIEHGGNVRIIVQPVEDKP